MYRINFVSLCNSLNLQQSKLQIFNFTNNQQCHKEKALVLKHLNFLSRYECTPTCPFRFYGQTCGLGCLLPSDIVSLPSSTLLLFFPSLLPTYQGNLVRGLPLCLQEMFSQYFNYSYLTSYNNLEKSLLQLLLSIRNVSNLIGKID